MRSSDFAFAVAALALATAGCGSRSSIFYPADERPSGDGGNGASGGDGGNGATGAQGGGGFGGEGGASNVFTVPISASPASAFEAEAHLAVTDGGVIAATWIAVDNGSFTPFVAYAFSSDDGQSWTAPAAAPTPVGLGSADPVVAVDGGGNFFLTYLGVDYTMTEPQTALYVARAPAGTTSFIDPVELATLEDGAFDDKPWIVVTPQNTVLVSWAAFDEGGEVLGELKSAQSSDGGMTFTTSVIVPEDPDMESISNLSVPCGSSGGRTYVTYVAFTLTGPQIRLSFSDDQGASWDPTPTIVNADVGVAFQDPNCVTDGEDVWISYGVTTDDVPDTSFTQKLDAIVLTRSSDSGQSFDEVLVLADDGLSAFHLLPNMARDPADDTLHIVHYNGQFDDDPNGSFRHAQTTGGEFPELVPTTLVEQPLFFQQDRGDPGWLGDYVGIAVRGGDVYSVYPENTTGFSHVLFSRIDLQ